MHVVNCQHGIQIWHCKKILIWIALFLFFLFLFLCALWTSVSCCRGECANVGLRCYHDTVTLSFLFLCTQNVNVILNFYRIIDGAHALPLLLLGLLFRSVICALFSSKTSSTVGKGQKHPQQQFTTTLQKREINFLLAGQIPSLPSPSPPLPLSFLYPTILFLSPSFRRRPLYSPSLPSGYLPFRIFPTLPAPIPPLSFP